MVHQILVHSPEETAQLAQRVAQCLSGGSYLSLEGDLGAGKTFFSRSLARALGVTEPVTSPTFVLQKLYKATTHPSIITLAHYDLYRISGYLELVDMGFEAHDEGALVVAEWGNLFVDHFPVAPVRICLEFHSENSRLVTLSGLPVADLQLP